MTRRLIEPPVYLSGAPLDVDKACETCAKAAKATVLAAAPAGGILAGALVGALAAYFVPKIMDRVLPQLDPNHGKPVTLEFED